MNAPENLTADTPELEALFDSILQEGAQERPAAAPKAEPGAGTDADVLNRVGRLTRSLHDTLAELGYTERLQTYASEAIPDTRERLAYVVTMTEQAASRALGAVETAQPLQDELEDGAEKLAARWDALYRNELSVDEFRLLAGQTRDYLRAAPEKARATSAQLREIMMAQDFQDLTGQVIKRITDCAQEMENQLLKLLIDHAPPEKRSEAHSLLNGPQINGKGRDVVTSQAQVDELLESLGF